MPKGIYQREKNSKIYQSRILTEHQDYKISLFYKQGANQTEIAQRFGVDRRAIRRSLRRTDTQIDPKRKGLSGEKNPAWKGGKILRKGGYVSLHRPNHPSANQGGYVAEHRLVMEKMIGRILKKKEVVHHKNGIPGDNRPENLLLFRNNGEHLGVELMGKIPNWTKEGKKKIASRSIPSMKGIPQKLNGSGVRMLRRKQIQRFLHETCDLQNTGPVAELGQLPPGYQRRKK